MRQWSPRTVLARARIALLASLVLAAPRVPEAQELGYRDTPMLPGGRWHVHDPDRPHPPIVQPGVAPGAAPSDAIVLFSGRDLSAFMMEDGTPADWLMADGAMTVPPRAGYGDYTPASIRQRRDLQTRAAFGDVQLHAEFRMPAKIAGASQTRGNSGILFMGRYEIQILDSWNNPTYADGQAAAIYGQTPPLVNASMRPGAWQSYDILFERPHFDASGKVVRDAFVTVLQNGVLVQDHQAILGSTHWRTLPAYAAHGDALPIVLQDHVAEVSFRNIWVRRLTLAE